MWQMMSAMMKPGKGACANRRLRCPVPVGFFAHGIICRLLGQLLVAFVGWILLAMLHDRLMTDN